MRRAIKVLLLCLLVSAFRLPPSAFAQVDRIVGKPFATRSAVLGRHGMVCTSVPAASQVGLDVLKRGGNAVDAAIAANATLGLMEPISNGVGGDLFAIVYCAKENKLYGLNGSGRSPQGLSYEQMREAVAKLNRNFIPPTGMLPINVPGAVDGWTTLHDKFGKLTLADDLSGAIDYAEDGFPVTQTIAFYWGRNLTAFKGLPGAWAETYHLPGTDRAPGEGDVFKNPAPRAHAPRHRRTGPRRFLQRRDRRQDRRLHAGQRRLPAQGRFRATPFRVGRARHEQLPRLRRVRTPRQRPGHRHAANPQHPRRLRPQGDGFPDHADLPHDDRGEETRLGRPREVLRRRRLLQAAREVARLQGIRRRTPQAHQPRQSRAVATTRATRTWTRATRSTCAPPTTRATWSRSSRATIAAWAAASAYPAWGSCSRTAVSFSRWNRAMPTCTRRASARSTRSSPAS